MIWLELLEVPIIVALLTYSVTKLIDIPISVLKEKREFQRFKKGKIYNEIEELKNEVSELYELAANWKGYEEKVKDYLIHFEKDHILIGRFNKYPSIVDSARDTVHLCKIVASCEKEGSNDLVEKKEELGKKYKLFLQKCDDYINSLS